MYALDKIFNLPLDLRPKSNVYGGGVSTYTIGEAGRGPGSSSPEGAADIVIELFGHAA